MVFSLKLKSYGWVSMADKTGLDISSVVLQSSTTLASNKLLSADIGQIG